MPKKSIMFLSSGMIEGGSEEIILNLAKHLKPKYNIYVTSLVEGPIKARFNTSQINYLPLSKARGNKIAYLKYLIYKLNIQIIFCNYFHQAHLLFVNRIKTVEIVHGPYPWLIDNQHYLAALKQSSRIVCVSKPVYNFMAEHFGDITDKLTVIENGIDEAKLKTTIKPKEMKQKLKIPPESFIIGNLGRICDTKGIEHIIELARMLKNRYKDIYFLIPGDYTRDPVYYQKLREQVARYNLTNILFPGFINNVANILQIYDIFVFPSRIEGLQLALLEALRMGLPVITTNVGVVTFDQDMIDKKIGFILEDYNDEIFLEKAEILINNPGLRKKISHYNKTIFNQKYLVTDMVKGYENLIDKLLVECD